MIKPRGQARASIVRAVRRQAGRAEGSDSQPEAARDEQRREAQAQAAGAAARCQPDAHAQPLPASPAGRAAYYRKFGLGRNKLREATMRGDVPGLRKASW
ncbi:MAG: 30S ribosomal protein S14 [Chromatiales bacterium]|nr:30S ribosomal protein S14 [Chromatiales bacterium]